MQIIISIESKKQPDWSKSWENWWKCGQKSQWWARERDIFNPSNTISTPNNHPTKLTICLSLFRSLANFRSKCIHMTKFKLHDLWLSLQWVRSIFVFRSVISLALGLDSHGGKKPHLSPIETVFCIFIIINTNQFVFVYYCGLLSSLCLLMRISSLVHNDNQRFCLFYKSLISIDSCAQLNHMHEKWIKITKIDSLFINIWHFFVSFSLFICFHSFCCD